MLQVPGEIGPGERLCKMDFISATRFTESIAESMPSISALVTSLATELVMALSPVTMFNRCDHASIATSIGSTVVRKNACGSLMTEAVPKQQAAKEQPKSSNEQHRAAQSSCYDM